MILTRTPLRVSCFGGGTDYPQWFMEHGGCVLGMAINKFVYVGVKHMPPGQLSSDGLGHPLRYRVQYSKVDDCQHVDDIKHPAVRAALKYLKIEDSLEFHIFGDLPGRSGLGGSSVFSVGLLHALLKLKRLPIGDLAAEAISFEQHVVKEAVGYQDQIFAAHGGIKFITFKNGETRAEDVSISSWRRKNLEDHMILVYSGTMRDSHAMASQQIARIDKNYELLMGMKSLAMAARSYLENSDNPILDIGLMLEYTWQMKRSLAPDISSPSIDALYDKAKKLGAAGGKLLGAGGGGFMLLIVPPDRQEHFISNIGAECVKFKIVYEGSKTIIEE